MAYLALPFIWGRIGVDGGTPLEVSTENVRAFSGGKPLKVYTFEELMAAEKSRQSAQRVGLALQAFGAALHPLIPSRNV